MEANSRSPAERPLGFQGKYCQFKWKFHGSSSILPSWVPSKILVGPFHDQVYKPRDEYLDFLDLLFIDQSSGDCDGDFAKNPHKESFSGLWWMSFDSEEVFQEIHLSFGKQRKAPR